MKKLMGLIILVGLFFVGNAFAAGTITAGQVKTIGPNEYTLTFTCTADASDGSYPTTVTGVNPEIEGWITEVEVNPGSTAPTANYDIAITTDTGADISGSGLIDLSATVTEVGVPQDKTGNAYWPRVVGSIVPVITNNSINSAVLTVKVKFIRRK